MTKIGLKCTVAMADGTELRGSAGMDEIHPVLWIWLDDGYDKDEMTALFSDPEKTAVIKSIVDMPLSHSRSTQTYEGYTSFSRAQTVGKQIQIMLSKA